MTPTRMQLGPIRVTAVSDGILKSSLDCILGLDRATCEQLAGSAFDAPIFLPVNCFLLETEGRRMLIDAGSGETALPAMGRLPDNLRAIGVAPESIEIILLTHLHPDHSNGLIDREGRPVFPNAELILHEREAAFWLKREAGEGDNERVRRNLVASKRATAPYRLRAVADGEALPGITAVLQPGHTPGHTCWLISGGGRRLLIWGDIVHLPKIQVPRPEAALVFDVDPVEAPRTRSRVLDWVSREQLPVGGAHLDAPGFGLFSRNGARYAYAPLT